MSRELKKIQEEQPGLQIEEIDVVASPIQSWQDGIRMIPALVRGKRKLSGVFLTAQQIRDFLSIP